MSESYSPVSNNKSVRAERFEGMPSQAAAGGANADLANNHGDDTQDGLEIYKLANARRVYKKCRPPFVFDIARRSSRPGDHKFLVLANEDATHRKASKLEKTKIFCRAYDVETAFWTLDLDDKRYIVSAVGETGHKGGPAYRIWWGPEEGFGRNAIAFSDYVGREVVRTRIDDNPDDESHDEHRDEENEARFADATQPSSRREPHSRKLKSTGRNRLRHLAAATAAEEEQDERLKAKSERRRVRALRKQKRHVPYVNAIPNNPSLPTPSARTSPSTPSSDSPPAGIPMKRERSSSMDPTGQPPEASQRRSRHRARSPSIIEISHTPNPLIDRYKQSHTTLHISLSTNDYGAVPIYLRSCLTIETFFASALAAWGLEGRDREVAAVTVKFDWLKDEGPMVVRRQVVDSFQKMLETIAEAPIWMDGDRDGDMGRRGCDVRVKIVMKQG